MLTCNDFDQNRPDQSGWAKLQGTFTLSRPILWNCQTPTTHSLLHAEHLQHIRTKVCFFKVKSSIGNFQCVSDFRPFNIRRRITSMPPCELILLIQPWVLFRLMFLGWYSVPLFRVRTCWYCQGTCWNTPEPSACEEIVSEALKTCVLAAAPGPIQLLNDLR